MALLRPDFSKFHARSHNPARKFCAVACRASIHLSPVEFHQKNQQCCAFALVVCTGSV